MTLAALGAGCGAPHEEGAGALGRPYAGVAGNQGRIEAKRIAGRPRLTLVSRDGDPQPAIAVVFTTGLGSALTTALGAVVEHRLRAAGFEPDVRVDRDAFRVRVSIADPAKVAPLFTAVAAAAVRPIAPASGELALAAQRLASLGRNPLDAAELSPITACTGALGLAPGERVPSAETPEGLREIESARARALGAARTSIGVAGPAAFAQAVTQALERTSGWLEGPAAIADPAPAADVASAYVSPSLERRGARLSLAVRVPDPAAAAAAAERLGASESPLLARVHTMGEAWRVLSISGVARAHGGCVSVTLETSHRSTSDPLEPSAAAAAAIVRREVSAALDEGDASGVAARQILTAADPRDAASRAAWWAAASSLPPSPPRWVAALGAPSPERGPREPAARGVTAAQFQGELDRALATVGGAERRLSVERGQGELWLLLASPCGVAEEGLPDAGASALATLAAIAGEARRSSDVALEPWIGSDGVGVLAHAPLRHDRESAAELARRVADAAARALTATTPSGEALAEARATILAHLERSAGRQATALEAFASAVAPDHPSWVEPFGVFRRVVEATPDGVRARAHALAAGPLRLAVIANADAAQAAVAADAVDRWLSPTTGPRVCRIAPSSAARAGRVEVRLPEGAPLAQAIVGAPLPVPVASPAGPYAYRDLAEVTVAALDGPSGALGSALAGAAANASARWVGGARAPALIVDVRAPEHSLGAAVAEVKALLLRWPLAATEAELERAAAIVRRRHRDARVDPRRRLGDLWASANAVAPPSPSLAGWRAFLAGTLRDPALIVVEATPR